MHLLRAITISCVIALSFTIVINRAISSPTHRHKSPVHKRPSLTQSSETGWVTVATFEGDIDNPNLKTETFKVGARWKIEWATEEGRYGPQGSLVVFVNPIGSGTVFGEAVAHNGGGNGTSLEYGAGEYYLQILSNQHHVIRVMTQN